MIKALKISTAILATAFCLDLGFVLTFGDIGKLPASYIGMAEATVQGFRCGWSVPVPERGIGCYSARQPKAMR